MTAPPPAAGPRRALIALLLCQMSFGLLAMTICLPSMAQWSSLFGARQSSVQLTFSAYVVTSGCLQLVYGPLSDRLGRQRVLLFGLALGFAGSVAAALAPSLGWLIAARSLQGAGAAAGMVVGRAMVQDQFSGPVRTQVMAYIGMTMGMCPPLATLVGGQLHVQLGWRANFVLMAVMAALLWLAAWQRLPPDRPRAPPAAGQAEQHWLANLLAAYARLARERAFWPHVISLGLTTTTFYTFLTGAPIVLASYGIGPDRVGWFIMTIPLSYIVGNFMTSQGVRRLGEARVQMIGHALALCGVGLMLGLALAGLQHPLAFALPMAVLGLGHGLLVPPTMAGTVGLVPALAGTASAAAGLLQQLLGGLGAYSVGLVSHQGAANLGWMMLASSAGAAGVMAWLHATRRRAG